MRRRDFIIGAPAVIAYASLDRADAQAMRRILLMSGGVKFPTIPISLGARVAVMGDSIYSTTYRPSYWAQIASRGIAYLPGGNAANKAVPGRLLSGAAPSVDANFFSDLATVANVQIIEINGGTNDISASQFTDTAVIGAWKSIMSKAASVGKFVTCCPITPRPATPNGFTTQMLTYVASVNSFLAGLNNPHVAVLDISAFSAVNTLVDGIHPNEVGSLQLTAGRTAGLLKFMANGDILSQTNTDVNNLVAAAGFFPGTGGTLANGATGTVATGWTVDAFHTGTGPTVVASVLSNPAGGQWQQIVVGGTSPSDGSAMSVSLNLGFVTLGQNYPNGTTFEPVYEFQVDAGSAQFYGHDFAVSLEQPGFAGGSGTIGSSPGPSAFNSANQAGAYTGARRGPPAAATAAVGIVSGQLKLAFVAAGSGVPIAVSIRIGRVGVRAVPNPTAPTGP
jgi:hypothetical protein